VICIAGYQFTILKHGRIIKNTSRVFKAIIDKPQYCDGSFCIAISDIYHFEASIYQINYLRASMILKEGDDLKLDVSIEELIFYHEEDAASMLNYINDIRRTAYL